MSLQLYVSFILATVVILVVPGPTIITVINQSVNHGRKSTLPLILGVFCGDLSAMSFSLLGLGALLQTSALLFSIFKWAGASYLIYLGIRSYIQNDIPVAKKEASTGKNHFQLFQSSFLVTILNPKSIAFFVAFFPQFVIPSESLSHQFLILGSTFLFLAVINAFLYSFFAVKMGHFINIDTIKKWFKRLGGGVLIGAGIVTLAIKDK